ncbi:MAG: hypothetical protein HC888_18195 [Candidatus Competibacteraceae bacterium]|nr:hypothetical protein [Candidatus Competibacteraceae bacterium]
MVEAENGADAIDFLTSFTGAVDLVLGIDERAVEGALDLAPVRDRHGYEQYGYDGVGYHKVGWAYHHLRPTPADVVYDLGCGYGRVLFYGALATEAGFFRGIELVEARWRAGCAVRERLGLVNVELVLGNVLDQDLSDGTIFFLLNAFSNATLERVAVQLERVAQRKPIRIVSVNWSNLYLAERAWLREIDLGERWADLRGSYGLRLFASRETKTAEPEAVGISLAADRD